MMVRKPTKIELKPEDDLLEYEEYKKKQTEMNKKIDVKQSLKSEKLDSNAGNPFKMTLANELFKNTQSNNIASSQQQFNSFNSNNTSGFSYNLQRSGQNNNNDTLDLTNLRNDSPHINQLFSLLLNNLNSNPSFTSNIDNNTSNNSNIGMRE